MRFFQFQEDARGQTRRLLCLFAVAVAALLIAVNAALALAWQLSWGLWAPLGAGYPRYFWAVNTAVTLLFVLGGWWLETAQLQNGGVRLAERLGARAAQPSGHPAEQRLENVVEELAIAAGMRAPAVMVRPRDDTVNAFATGWQPEDAALAVTQGALDHLTREELQGLVAHELGHLREGDTLLHMRLAGMVFGLETLFRWGQTLWAPDEAGRRPAWALMGLALMAAGGLGWLAGRALQAAVSRQRECLADARAVQWTRNREGLGRVLRKALTQATSSISPPAATGVYRHLWLWSEGSDRWFQTHPPLHERIARVYGRPMPALPLDDTGAERDLTFADTQPHVHPRPV